jgi:hypothetical protein
MKIHFVAVSCLFLAGCAAIESELRMLRVPPVERRIKADPAYFASLTPDQQSRLRAGSILTGDSKRFVLMSRGEPKRYLKKTGKDAVLEVWEYVKIEYRKSSQRYSYETLEEKHGKLKKVTKYDTVTVSIPIESINYRVIFSGDTVLEVEELIR